MKRFITFSFIAMALVFAVIGIIREQNSEATLDVSSALSVIANENDMAKSALANNKIVFSADDFKRYLNVAEISSITITSVPSLTDGCLCVGDVAVNVGQTISSETISLLNYRAANEDVKQSSFNFKVNGGEYEMTCMLYFLTRENSAPTLSLEDERSFAVSTHQTISVFGKVSGYDADGDALRYEIVTYAKNGVLDFDGRSGEYTYTPQGAYFGEDSFEYVAVDKYGNYSSSRKVSLTVEKLKSDVVFCDMQGHRDHNAAMTMVEKGIMSGVSIGNNTYFMPDKAVSRVDFVAMLMNAIGYGDVENVANTGFDDDGEIPASMKGYVKKAKEMGLITGTVNADGEYLFEGNREISRAEASLIVSKLISAEVPTIKPIYPDRNDIPAWAEDAIYVLADLGILTSIDGSIAPSESLTRAQVANMLYVLDYYLK